MKSGNRALSMVTIDFFKGSLSFCEDWRLKTVRIPNFFQHGQKLANSWKQVVCFGWTTLFRRKNRVFGFSIFLLTRLLLFVDPIRFLSECHHNVIQASPSYEKSRILVFKKFAKRRLEPKVSLCSRPKSVSDAVFCFLSSIPPNERYSSFAQ